MDISIGALIVAILIVAMATKHHYEGYTSGFRFGPRMTAEHERQIRAQKEAEKKRRNESINRGFSSIGRKIGIGR